MPRNVVAGELAEGCPALDERALLELLRETIVDVCGSQKAGAFDLGLTEPQLSRKLSGSRCERLALVELTRAPDVLVEFSARLAKACGHELRRRTASAQRKQAIVQSLEQLGRLLALMTEDVLEDRAS